MSPAETEYRLARSLDDYKARRTQGEKPDPEDYQEELGDGVYPEFLEMVRLEQMLDEVLDPGAEDSLPRDFGPYTLIRELGRGAVGIVYEGVHRDLGRHEAVKVLRTGFDEEGTALDRFRHEAKVLARVKHDHIVEIYGAGQVDGRPYYAMTLLQGRTLSQVARGGELPSYRDLCRGLAGVADALHVLHEQGVMHRDVKPSNILVTDDGRMVLADFGLARSLQDDRMTRTGQALGTPLYMSPEQILARRDDIDGRTDVYGLGASLYEVCAGRPAFQTDDLRALLQMIINERPELLRKVAAQVPGPCADIAMKAMEKKREDRYADAGAMRDDLLAFADGERVRGRPVSPMRHGLRRLRQYTLPIAATLLAVLGLGFWYVNRAGTLTVTGTAEVAVLIDGEERGNVPQTLELEPGTYEVVLRHEMFEDWVERVELEPGQKVHVPYVIPAAKRADDPATLKLLAEAGGAELGNLHVPLAMRGTSRAKTVAVAVLPGGMVRAEALGSYYLEITTALDVDAARLVFKRMRDGVEGILYDKPLGSPETARILADMPDEVLGGVQPGDTVLWGVEAAKGESIQQTFTVVAADPVLEARLADLGAALANQEPAVRAALEARALLHAGLASEAYVQAGAVTDLADPSKPLRVASVEGQGLAWLVMRAALREVSDPTQSQLGRLVGAIVLDRLPEDLRAALTAPASGD